MTTTLALSDRYVTIDIEDSYLPAWTHDQDDIDAEVEAVVRIIRQFQRKTPPNVEFLDDPFPDLASAYSDRYSSREAVYAAQSAGSLLPDDATFTSALDLAVVYLESFLRRHAITERQAKTNKPDPGVERFPFSPPNTEG
jgi:hypothetical protein